MIIEDITLKKDTISSPKEKIVDQQVEQPEEKTAYDFISLKPSISGIDVTKRNEIMEKLAKSSSIVIMHYSIMNNLFSLKHTDTKYIDFSTIYPN